MKSTTPRALRSSADSLVIRFGSTPKAAPDYLPSTPGWDHVVRLYRPNVKILEDTRKIPGTALDRYADINSN